jgi:SAM-dependent methyltransferase
MSGMPVRALSFGPIADAYERFRPDYPDAVFDTVAAYGGAPLHTALEIGAGTGKATRLFARHGVRVTATDPDAAMLAELRKWVPSEVKTRQAAFEDLAAERPGGGDGGDNGRDGTYGLVFVAAALHWTRAEGRWERVAALLEPDGVFASFAGPYQPGDRDVAEAVRVARAPFLGSDEVSSPDGTTPDAPMQWPGTELQQSELFGDVQQHVVERRFTVSARHFVGYLSTVSAYLQLEPAVRQQTFDAIIRVLPETLEITADVIVHLARRRPE